MGKGSSESNTTSQSSTTNADQRVAAEGQAVAIGAGAQYTPSTTNIDNFPQEVAAYAKKLLDFTGGILSGANDLIAKVISANESALEKALSGGEKSVAAANETTAAAVQTSQTGTSLNLNNILPTVIVGAVIIAGLMFFKKKG